ncbi:MAG TPA: DUF5060 domain-containing protein [Thermoguttaceae bacterium]|nr:DUF5060 domain-containing protein [Thermoguttaceae bacterium]
MKRATIFLSLSFGINGLLFAATAQTPALTFRGPQSAVEVYDFAEVQISAQHPSAANPFTDASVVGEFRRKGDHPVQVDGFCDAADGSLFRVRFMPSEPGPYDYTVTFRQGAEVTVHEGSFIAIASRRSGVLRVDAEHRQHFVWEGNGEHYFWNGTTTYYLMGWDDETIRSTIDRLAGYKINRLRVLLYGRNKPRPWNQPVVPTERFQLHLNPWPAERPNDVANPGFDLTRFNVDHWQKYERLLRYARERDVVVSVIFYIGGQVLPTPFEAGSAEEDLYYRYGVARLAAFSNVTWDLGNEYNFHRPAPTWADEMGAKVKSWDPYNHLCSAHNVTHRTPNSAWCDMQLIQRWDDGQNAFMLGQRQEQEKTGRIIPQINEEYGYEDLWEKTPGQRQADTRRRCAWEIVMAGCYQTTGESARTGTGVAPDTGGGWVNGRGDDSMTMLGDYRRLAEFFTAFDWWTCQPRNSLVEQQLPCLAVEGQRYVVYLPTGGRATIKLNEGKYRAQWFNPRTGDFAEAGVAVAPVWTSPDTPDREDWTLLLERDDAAVDRTPPRLIAATAAGSKQVDVVFSKSVEQTSACDPANYSLSGNIRVVTAALIDEAGRTVRLTTSPLTEDVRYTLTVRNIRDRAEQPNAIRTEEHATFLRRNPGRPLVVLAFNEGQGQTTGNTGASAESDATATLTAKWPRWSTNSPAGGDGKSLDFGDTSGEYAVDLGNEAPELLRGLKSFTITGWLNCRSLAVGPGGNRIVHMADTMGSRAGLDLVVEAKGALVLGVNAYPDVSPASSRTTAISADPNVGPENWRFFAVTYDATTAMDNIQFYLGDARRPAELDRAVTYAQGELGPRTGPLTVGAFSPAIRTGKGDRVFRGLIDDIRVFGSSTNGAGALDLDQVRNIQLGERAER